MDSMISPMECNYRFLIIHLNLVLVTSTGAVFYMAKQVLSLSQKALRLLAERMPRSMQW